MCHAFIIDGHRYKVQRELAKRFGKDLVRACIGEDYSGYRQNCCLCPINLKTFAELTGLTQDRDDGFDIFWTSDPAQ